MTDDQLEAALCAWEWVLEEGDDQAIELREKISTSELRMRVGALAPAICKAWEMGGDCDLITPFDWEFVPLFMMKCVDWNDCSLKPFWSSIVSEIWDNAREDEAEKDDAHRRELAGELRDLVRRVAGLDEGLAEDLMDFVPRIEGLE